MIFSTLGGSLDIETVFEFFACSCHSLGQPGFFFVLSREVLFYADSSSCSLCSQTFRNVLNIHFTPIVKQVAKSSLSTTALTRHQLTATYLV